MTRDDSRPTVTVYTRQGCKLCADAERLVWDVAGGRHVHVRLVDIDSDPALIDRYTARVPVVAIDGREVAEFVVDPDLLAQALVEYSRS